VCGQTGDGPVISSAITTGGVLSDDNTLLAGFVHRVCISHTHQLTGCAVRR